MQGVLLAPPCAPGLQHGLTGSVLEMQVLRPTPDPLKQDPQVVRTHAEVWARSQGRMVTGEGIVKEVALTLGLRDPCGSFVGVGRGGTGGW